MQRRALALCILLVCVSASSAQLFFGTVDGFVTINGLPIESANVTINVSAKSGVGSSGSTLTDSSGYYAVTNLNTDPGDTVTGDTNGFATQTTVINAFSIAQLNFTSALPVPTAIVSPPGGGGGRAGRYRVEAPGPYDCIETWVCSSYSACGVEGIQYRECIDAQGCQSSFSKPPSERVCTFERPPTVESPQYVDTREVTQYPPAIRTPPWWLKAILLLLIFALIAALFFRWQISKRT